MKIILISETQFVCISRFSRKYSFSSAYAQYNLLSLKNKKKKRRKWQICKSNMCILCTFLAFKKILIYFFQASFINKLKSSNVRKEVNLQMWIFTFFYTWFRMVFNEFSSLYLKRKSNLYCLKGANANLVKKFQCRFSNTEHQFAHWLSTN